MTDAAGKPVIVRTGSETSFGRRLSRLCEQIRKKALVLYSKRARGGIAKMDWSQAEREAVLSHVAGIEDNEHYFRITAAVPDIDAGRLIVTVLPDSIVVEGRSAANASINRYSEFPLHAPINTSAVRAELSHGYLTIVAPKAEPIAAGPQKGSSVNHRA